MVEGLSEIEPPLLPSAVAIVLGPALTTPKELFVFRGNQCDLLQGPEFSRRLNRELIEEITGWETPCLGTSLFPLVSQCCSSKSFPLPPLHLVDFFAGPTKCTVLVRGPREAQYGGCVPRQAFQIKQPRQGQKLRLVERLLSPSPAPPPLDDPEAVWYQFPTQIKGIAL